VQGAVGAEAEGVVEPEVGAGMEAVVDWAVAEPGAGGSVGGVEMVGAGPVEVEEAL
jgi:hypothetical protein